MRSFSKPISRITPLPDEASKLRRLANVHWGPLAATLLLALIGLATVNSASAELGTDYLPRQATWVVVGCLAILVVFRFGYHLLVDSSPLLYGFGLFLLVLVLIIGQERGGARSWLVFGPFTAQPSEFTKLATALLLCHILAKVQGPFLSLREILISVLTVAVPMVLIVLERDLGNAAMYLPMLAGVLLVGGVRFRQLLIAALLGLVLAAGLWTFGMRDYQRQRVLTFLSPDSDPLGAGYQLRQSKIAVGSGQWWGRGYGQGTQSQLRFLPERHTDFVMAVLAEEWGFLGALTVLGLYGLYIFSAAQIAIRARDRAGILLVTCLLSVFTFHVLYNTAMVIGLLPITGIPLPYLSYGGSFTLVNFLATGLILNVDYRRYVNR